MSLGYNCKKAYIIAANLSSYRSILRELVASSSSQKFLQFISSALRVEWRHILLASDVSFLTFFAYDCGPRCGRSGVFQTGDEDVASHWDSGARAPGSRVIRQAAAGLRDAGPLPTHSACTVALSVCHTLKHEQKKCEVRMLLVGIWRPRRSDYPGPRQIH
jgi:hypothetical protein